MGKTLVIAAIVIGAALVVAVLVYVVYRSTQGPVARRRELTNVKAENAEYRASIRRIEEYASRWSDLDSVLATEVKRELHALSVKREKLEDNR